MMEKVNSSMIYLIYCKNFCKCCNVTQHNKKEKFFKKANVSWGGTGCVGRGGM
jgi:hypothetical protein